MKGKPVIINFNTSHYRWMKQDGGSILSSILPVSAKVTSKIMPAKKSILPGIATGVSSALGSFAGFTLNLENLESLENLQFLRKVRENLE